MIPQNVDDSLLAVVESEGSEDSEEKKEESPAIKSRLMSKPKEVKQESKHIDDEDETESDIVPMTANFPGLL